VLLALTPKTLVLSLGRLKLTCSSGGRTAWSATVTISGQNVAARYWYDGQFINNAKEDAAEVALMRLNFHGNTPTSYSGQVGNGHWGRR
jgi:hypothetical protein